MSALTKQHREEVLKGTLTAAFDSRFEELSGQLAQFITERVKEKHPDFVKALKDSKVRPYLSVTFNPKVLAAVEGNPNCKSKKFGRPHYGQASSPPETSWGRADDSVDMKLTGEVVAPATMGDYIIPVKHPTHKAYDAAWADYIAAQTKLADLLNSYNSREKFEADFPEFAKYLPARAVKMALPAVIVKDVLRDLARVGVPGKEKKHDA